MTIIDGAPAVASSDSRYRQGMAHLQVGEWQAAIGCFEEVIRRHPHDAAVQRALEEAEFKAGLDARTRVRARRWTFPWRALAVRGLIVASLAVLAVLGVRLIRQQLVPVVAQAREEQRLAQLASDGERLLKAGKLEEAEARYQALLAAVPDSEPALLGLQQVAEEREILDLYGQAVALQEAGDCPGAVALLTQLQVRRPRYQDVGLRIDACRREQQRAALIAQADADYEAGDLPAAMAGYEQLRELYASYERPLVDERLYDLYMRAGRGLLDQDPPAAEEVARALDYFTKSLSLRPNSTEAAAERDVARFFLEGQAAFQEGHWERAIGSLRAAYDRRPGYLGGLAAEMLYQAYIAGGQQAEAGEDLFLAYERYSAGCGLPAGDTTFACVRKQHIEPLLPPTPTPSPTPTPTPLPTITPWSTWTPVPPPGTPTPTPTPVPLSVYRNKILFWSDNEEQPGLWVMDPDGKNRRYLGSSRTLRREYDALRERESYSPDGQYRVYVGPGAQLYVLEPPHPQYGQLPARQLTFNTGISYDPVWAPDGGRIAYVSNENGSDDIWIIYGDGADNRALVNNKWEWDKHPTWSPDSRRLAFWSNRNLLKQIYVMNADGTNVVNISQSEWDEYDPLWVK
jgi:tetratricopeptide (TPR) repeat protein